MNSRYHSKLIINILQVFFGHTGIGTTTADLHSVYVILDMHITELRYCVQSNISKFYS